MDESDPWRIELIVVRDGVFGGGERKSLSRDVDAKRLTRLLTGVYVRSAALAGMNPEQLHVLSIRALAATSDDDLVISHWSAAVVHGLPDAREHLARPHVTVARQEDRTRLGAAAHVFALFEEEVVEVHGIRVTTVPRTVVDLAGAAAFTQGLAVADAALRAGVPREIIEQAVDLAGPRRSAKRIGEVVAFAHPGAESALESESRYTFFRYGAEPQELQHRFTDRQGLIGFSDTFSPSYRVAGEADGAAKILDPRLAKDGPARAVLIEKLREDRMRRQVAGLARWGARESRSVALLGPILAAAGLPPERHRPTLADWARVARAARPRRPWRLSA